MSVCMKTEINDKTIEVYIALESYEGPYCMISEITKAVSNEQYPTITKLPSRVHILSIEGTPNITPHNIKEKLKTYLTFL